MSLLKFTLPSKPDPVIEYEDYDGADTYICEEDILLSFPQGFTVRLSTGDAVRLISALTQTMISIEEDR